MEHLMKETNKEELWEQVNKFYMDKFGATPELIEIATNIDLLQMCARGASNEKIAEILELDEEVVSYIIDKYLGFMGWKTDLSFNPIKLYKELGSPEIAAFVEEVILRHGHLMNYDLKNIYMAAFMTDNLERLLDEKWI